MGTVTDNLAVAFEITITLGRKKNDLSRDRRIKEFFGGGLGTDFNENIGWTGRQRASFRSTQIKGVGYASDTFSGCKLQLEWTFTNEF